MKKFINGESLYHCFPKISLKMKLTSLFLIVSLFHLHANDVLSQNRKISLNMEQVTIENVLNKIEAETDYKFLYENNVFDSDRIVSITVKKEKLSSVLKTLFKGINVSIIFLEKQIHIKPGNTTKKKEVQQKEIIGIVNDKDGQPLPGANILEKGTSNGTQSDFDGKFVLAVTDENAILIVSYLGYLTKEIPVNGKTSLTIVLTEDTEVMDEVVVVGYGVMKKSDVNAAIVSIKAEDLVKTANSSFTDMLAGRAAGLTVTQNTAAPGGGIDILVRGAGSVGAGNQPLYVIDGFPVASSGVSPGSGNQFDAGSKNPLSDINANDIESIEVLKDASATAIYGARGSNGVIIITTKRGSEGTKIEYNGNISFQQISKRPDLLNAREFMTETNVYLREGYLSGNNLPPYGNNDPAGVSPFIPKYTDDQISNAGEGTDWYDLITQQGKIQQHNISISNGNEKSRQLVSFNYFNQEGVVKSSGFERFTLRVNLDQKITDWWDYGLSLTTSLVKEQNAALGNGRDATAGIIESAMNYNPLTVAQRDPLTGAWIEDPEQALLNHPLGFLDITDNSKSKRLLANVFTNIHFTDNLWLKLSGGVDFRDGLRQSYYPKTTKYGREVGGEANQNEVYREDYVADIVLNYNKTFNDNHKFLGLIGYSYQNQNNEGNYARAQGFTSDALLYYTTQAGQAVPRVSSWKNQHILASYFTRLQYAFKDRYLFTFTGRVDGSDRFGENNRYAFFPSGAFAWKVKQEDFMQEADWLSDLKLRFSLGQVGNENIGNDAASEYYAFQGRNYYFNGTEVRGVNLAKLGNPDLKWETTTEVNFGVDFGMLKNRISGSIDVFYKEIDDMLSSRVLPHNSIVGSIPWNIGKTQSKGLEIALNTVNIDKGDFRWRSSVAFTLYRDKWLERDPKLILQPYQSEKDPIYAVFSLIPDGIKQANESTPAMPDLQPGQQKYKDINGLDADGNLTGVPDGKINQADVVMVGNTAPNFNLGFNNTFTYKDFDFSFFLYASEGAYRWPVTTVEHGVYGSYGVQRLGDNYNFLSEISERWSSTNQESSMPSGEVNAYSQFGQPSWEKASYIRLKNISLGYDFTRLIKEKSGLEGRIFVEAQNLFTITNYSGLDPEVENNRAAYPQQQTFSLGLNINF